MPGPGAKYFDELQVGDQYVTPARTITEADVVFFAGFSGDYNPLHTDEEFARRTPFKGRIAHASIGLSVAAGLQARLGLFDGTVLAVLEVNEHRFLKPIYFNDTIRVRLRVAEKRETSKPDRGVILFERTVINQRDEELQKGKITIMMFRKQ